MHTFVTKLARAFALLGGLALTSLILMTCLSIVGRSLNSVLHGDFVQAFAPGLASMLLATGVGPINGDFELVEAGMAFTIFAFLPLCHLNGAHASVDIFTAKLPVRIRSFLAMLIEVIFAAVLVLIAIKLFGGMESKRNSGQTTFLLQYPLWWGYAISLLGAVAAAFVAVYVALSRVVEVATGRVVLPVTPEAEH